MRLEKNRFKSMYSAENKSLTPHLEFNAITIFCDIEWAERIHHDCFDESLDSMVKIPCCCVSVLPDEFMGRGTG